MLQSHYTNYSCFCINPRFRKGIILVLLSFLNLHLLFAQPSILVKNVSLVTMTSNETLKDYDLLIENGKIKKIGKRIASSPKYLIIDGQGKFLMPGLSDMHTHIPNYKDNQMPVNHFLMLYLASGVTTIRSMRGDVDHLILRDSVNKGLVLSPHLVLSAPPFSSRNTITDSIPSLVKRYKSNKFDFIKVLSVGSELQYNRITDKAKASSLKVTGHLPLGNLGLAINKGQYSIEHLQGYTNLFETNQTENLRKYVKLTFDSGIYNCPTMDWYFIGSLHYNLVDLKKREGMEYVPTAVKQKWQESYTNYTNTVKRDEFKKDSLHLIAIEEVIKMLKHGNCKILLSPDASGPFQVPGFGMKEEMLLFKKFGFSNYDILRAATYTAAEYFGDAKTKGLIKEGYIADLILLNANPLESIENFSQREGIFLNGRWFSQTYLINELKKIR